MTPLLGLRRLTTTLLHLASVGELIPDVYALAHAGLGRHPRSPRAIAAELLASERLPEFLAWAEAKYDYVFIDSPPSFVSDGAVIGRLADGVILVVRPDKTNAAW